jgi:hypothetical protein
MPNIRRTEWPAEGRVAQGRSPERSALCFAELLNRPYMKIKKETCCRPHKHWGEKLNFLSAR